MNNKVRTALGKLIASRGTGLIEQPQRLRGLLCDECPGCKLEIKVLVIAAEEKLVGRIQSSASAPWETLCGQLVMRLREDVGIDEVPARWAIESWGLALGRAVPVRATVGTGGVSKPPKSKPSHDVDEATQSVRDGRTVRGPAKAPPPRPVKASSPGWFLKVLAGALLAVGILVGVGGYVEFERRATEAEKARFRAESEAARVRAEAEAARVAARNAGGLGGIQTTTATLTVIRESAFSGALLSVDIYVDGDKIGSVGNGASITLPFSAKQRTHHLMLYHSIFITQADRDFEAGPGLSIRVIFSIDGSAVVITKLESV